MISFIPVQAIPNQRFQVVLNDQNCTIHLFQRGEYMYMDLTCNGVEIRTGAICLPNISLTQYPTPDFDGMLFFTDTTNHDEPPAYSGLGTRWLLCFDDGADDE